MVIIFSLLTNVKDVRTQGAIQALIFLQKKKSAVVQQPISNKNK